MRSRHSESMLSGFRLGLKKGCKRRWMKAGTVLLRLSFQPFPPSRLKGASGILAAVLTQNQFRTGSKWISNNISGQLATI